MNHFWDFVLDDAGPVAGVVFAGFLMLLFAVALFGGVYELGQFFTFGLYRALRYERKGICGKCKLPYESRTVRPADQMYGRDEVEQYSCPNGHVSIPQGNRHFAEW